MNNDNYSTTTLKGARPQCKHEQVTGAGSLSLGLLDLPNELLDHISVSLDHQPPSNIHFIELPASHWTHSALLDLKSLSAVSHRLRHVILPRLFRHARLNPACLTEFLDFVYTNRLMDKIETVVADLKEPYYDVHPAWWCRLLNEIPITRFTVGGSPKRFAEITRIPFNLDDCWAFNVPYQYLELQQSPDVALQQISYDDLPSLIGAKQWHTMKVNEGSSLAAYTTFEYFLKKPPSLISSIQAHLRNIPTEAGQESQQRISPNPAILAISVQTMIERLTEFSFVAIFPFYNHVDAVLKCIRKMKNLKKLFMKLCPEPNRSVLDDEIKAARGHFDINDPWNEITTAYVLTAHTIRFLGVEGGLESFTVDDIRVHGISDTITNCISEILRASWTRSGDCVWLKSTTFPLPVTNV